MTQTQTPRAVAVYCASSLGHNKTYQKAATSVAAALVKAGRPLVYGGGKKGIMGVVSNAVLDLGGKVTGIIPYAMVLAGGEAEKTEGGGTMQDVEESRENETVVVVDSMHERKLEMAKASGGFFCLPGGFGTFEELFEVTTWSQIGIHNKPVIILNVLGYYNPIRQQIQNAIEQGFISPLNEDLILFVDGPEDLAAHGSFDWGSAAVAVLDNWTPTFSPADVYDWTRRRDGGDGEGVEAL